MARAADPNREPISSKRPTPWATILLVLLVLGGAGAAYWHFSKNPKDLQKAGDLASKAKDAAGDLAQKARGLATTCPIDLVTQGEFVAVTIKSTELDDLKRKYAKLRVTIKELEIDATVPKTEWPVLARKKITGLPYRLEDCTVSVYGIDSGGASTHLYSQSR